MSFSCFGSPYVKSIYYLYFTTEKPILQQYWAKKYFTLSF